MSDVLIRLEAPDSAYLSLLDDAHDVEREFEAQIHDLTFDRNVLLIAAVAFSAYDAWRILTWTFSVVVGWFA